MPLRQSKLKSNKKKKKANVSSLVSYDYTKGKLKELVDIIIESGAKLFVSAVGVPPREVVDRLHSAGILCSKMLVLENILLGLPG